MVSAVVIRVVDMNQQGVEDAEVTVDGRQYNKPQRTSKEGYLHLYIRGSFSIQVIKNYKMYTYIFMIVYLHVSRKYCVWSIIIC